MLGLYTIVWLDANAKDPMNSFPKKIGQNLELFSNVDDCAKFIQSNPHQSIYLIVSGSFARQIVPMIYDLPYVVQIYLFCGSISAYVVWSLDYLEKVLIFEHGDDVLERLWNDLNANLRALATSYLSQADQFKERAAQYRQKCG